MLAGRGSAFWVAMLAAVAAVLLFETLGALAAKRWGFRYGNLTAPMWVLYLLLGLFVQVALLDVRLTVTVAAVAAVVEATAGWAIAARIGPGRLEASRARPSAVTKLLSCERSARKAGRRGRFGTTTWRRHRLHAS